MDISRQRGGLGLISVPGKKDMALAKRVYLYDLLHRFGRVYPLPNTKDLVSVPIPVIRWEEPRSDFEFIYHHETKDDRELKRIQEEHIDTQENILRLLDVEKGPDPAFDDLTHQELESWWTNLSTKDPLFFKELEEFTRSGKFSLFDCPSLKRVGIKHAIFDRTIGQQLTRLIRRQLFFSLCQREIDCDPFWSLEGFKDETIKVLERTKVGHLWTLEEETSQDFREEGQDLSPIPEDSTSEDVVEMSLHNYFLPFSAEDTVFPIPEGDFTPRERVDFELLKSFILAFSEEEEPEDDISLRSGVSSQKIIARREE
jgi:hypothetical protein